MRILKWVVVAIACGGQACSSAAGSETSPWESKLTPGRYQVAGNGRTFTVVDTATGEVWVSCPDVEGLCSLGKPTGVGMEAAFRREKQALERRQKKSDEEAERYLKEQLRPSPKVTR